MVPAVVLGCVCVCVSLEALVGGNSVCVWTLTLFIPLRNRRRCPSLHLILISSSIYPGIFSHTWIVKLSLWQFNYSGLLVWNSADSTLVCLPAHLLKKPACLALYFPDILTQVQLYEFTRCWPSLGKTACHSNRWNQSTYQPTWW